MNQQHEAIKPATPLPFEVVEHGHVKRIYGRRPDGKRASLPISCVSIKQRKTGAGRGMSPRWLGFYPDEERDLAYIVHACNTLPQLEAENRRLREALEAAADALIANTSFDERKDAGFDARDILRELGEAA